MAAEEAEEACRRVLAILVGVAEEQQKLGEEAAVEEHEMLVKEEVVVEDWCPGEEVRDARTAAAKVGLKRPVLSGGEGVPAPRAGCKNRFHGAEVEGERCRGSGSVVGGAVR